MSEMVFFTDNYQDRSTREGYQFEFFCRRCGNGYSSTFKHSVTGFGGRLLRMGGDLVGGNVGDTARQLGWDAEWTRDGLRGSTRDKALARAVDEMKPHFEQCHRCGQWVCGQICWNGERGMCVTCAPKLGQEIAAGRGSAGRVAGRPDRARRRLVQPARCPAGQLFRIRVFRIRVTGARSLMTDPAHGIRASDADRDNAARTLADATAAGRISLPEHHTRLDALYAAVTEDEVAAVTADLPAGPAGPAGRGALLRMLGPYRCLLIGGQARRAGRFRMGRFCTVVAAFGGIELDLRAAQLSRDELTLTVWSLLARVTVIVPAHARVLDQVLVIGRGRTAPDDDGAAGSPVIRLRGISLAGSFRIPQV
jgi:Domain of unknown function (DUF1707)